jgi:hypothetical protein
VVELGEHVVEDEYGLDAVCAQQPERGQTQRARQRPGLAVARVPLGRQLSDPQGDVVAVRPDQRHPAGDLLATPLAHPDPQHLRDLVTTQGRVGDDRAGRHVHGPRLVVDRRDRAVRVRDVLGEVEQRRHPGHHELRAELRQVLVPRVQRRGDIRTRHPSRTSRQGLQQCVALLQHPVVVRPDPGEPGPPRHEQVVEEPAPLAGVALDDRQVLRREQHDDEGAEQVPRPLQGCPVELRAVRTPRHDVQLEQQRSRVVDAGLDASPYGRPFRARPYERGIGGDTVRAERRQVLDGLDEVGLALPVRPDEHADARLQRDLDLRVRPVVDQMEVRDVHEAGRARPRISSAGASA